MTHLDLFSGIGGFTLAAQRTGINTIYLSETNKDACRVLSKNFPSIPNLGDVRKIDGNWLRDFCGVDIITGGFPCTDLSQSSKGSHKGFEGKESGLFYQLVRLVLECDPKWIVIENVPQVLKYMDTIRQEMFYHEWDARTFEVGDFGCNCRRKRAFVIGCSVKGGSSSVLDFTAKRGSSVCRGGEEDVFPMCLPWKGGVSLERLGSCVVEDTKTNSTRIRKSDGVPGRMDGSRYLMLGNSVPPVIPAIIFNGIVGYENRTPKSGV